MLHRVHFPLWFAFVLCLVAAVVAQPLSAGPLKAVTDFEGASARVLEVESAPQRIRLMPGGDPQRGWPAWWCVQVQGATAAAPLTLEVVPSTLTIPQGHPGAGKPLSASWCMPTQAVWSVDGDTWHPTPVGTRSGQMMTWQLEAPAAEFTLAWGPMATPQIVGNWNRDLADRHDFVRQVTLATTREQRVVGGVRITATSPESPVPVVWLQARQHAWESGASWVARGLMNWLCGNHRDAVWLREHAEVFVIPIMDIDRTATGDGGKESDPRDHNRDWSDAPHYPEVAAVQKKVQAWSAADRPLIFVDLHNPGPRDRHCYYFVPPAELLAERQKQEYQQFVARSQMLWQAPIPFRSDSSVSGPGYHPLWHQMSHNWVIRHSGPGSIALCLETAWNTADSNPAGYAQVGASLGTVISQTLQQPSSGKTEPQE